jgi:hypothetical protein
MGGTTPGLSRRSFVAAGALGVAGLALRPRRTVAEVLDPRSPAGLWGVARTDDGLLGLWSSGGRPVVVRLTERGPVSVARIVATPQPGVAVAVAAGGPPAVLGAVEETVPVAGAIATSHLPGSVRAAMTDEVDGPLSVASLRSDEVLPRQPVARTLDGGATLELVDIPGGVAAAVLLGGTVWSVVQHPPSSEGDHCSSLTVTADGRPVLEVADLGAAGPASLVGPTSAPILSVSDERGRLRVWHLAGPAMELVAPGSPDDVAVHVADGRPIALLGSPDGATLLRHGGSGWEVVRDVGGTAGCRRVLAIGGEEPEFLVEAADGVLLVDGDGTVR